MINIENRPPIDNTVTLGYAEVDIINAEFRRIVAQSIGTIAIFEGLDTSNLERLLREAGDRQMSAARIFHNASSAPQDELWRYRETDKFETGIPDLVRTKLDARRTKESLAESGKIWVVDEYGNRYQQNEKVTIRFSDIVEYADAQLPDSAQPIERIKKVASVVAMLRELTNRELILLVNDDENSIVESTTFSKFIEYRLSKWRTDKLPVGEMQIIHASEDSSTVSSLGAVMDQAKYHAAQYQRVLVSEGQPLLDGLNEESRQAPILEEGVGAYFRSREQARSIKKSHDDKEGLEPRSITISMAEIKAYILDRYAMPSNEDLISAEQSIHIDPSPKSIEELQSREIVKRTAMIVASLLERSRDALTITTSVDELLDGGGILESELFKETLALRVPLNNALDRIQISTTDAVGLYEKILAGKRFGTSLLRDPGHEPDSWGCIIEDGDTITIAHNKNFQENNVILRDKKNKWLQNRHIICKLLTTLPDPIFDTLMERDDSRQLVEAGQFREILNNPDISDALTTEAKKIIGELVLLQFLQEDNLVIDDDDYSNTAADVVISKFAPGKTIRFEISDQEYAEWRLTRALQKAISLYNDNHPDEPPCILQIITSTNVNDLGTNRELKWDSSVNRQKILIAA